MRQAFPWLLLPSFWAARNRARRREPGDALRAMLFGGIAVAVSLVLFAVFFWLAWQLLDYEELGDYLIRLGLGWLFLTFLSFVAFSAIVTSLCTFFLAEDLRLLLPAPVPKERLFHSRFVRTVGAVLLDGGRLPAAGAAGHRPRPLRAGRLLPRARPLTVVPFVVIPCALGAVVTLGLVSVFPARRARDVLMLMGLLFAVALVLLLRFIRPERLLSVQSLPDLTAFFATLQSPLTPAAALLLGGREPVRRPARPGRPAASERPLVDGPGHDRARPASPTAVATSPPGPRRRRPARRASRGSVLLETLVAPAAASRPGGGRCWSRTSRSSCATPASGPSCCCCSALALVYVYNFRVLDLERIPYMSRLLKNAYAFVNLAMAAFVMSAIAVRFVFPAVSAEGHAFWIVRTAPVRMSSFLWSKFWTGFVPILLLAETLTLVSEPRCSASPRCCAPARRWRSRC